MLSIPNCFFLVKGIAEGETELNTFDYALLDAGVGDTNLLKVSSILPPGSIQIPPEKIYPGALVPIAYAFKFSANKGETIAASVAVGIPQDGSLPGLIMEHSGFGNSDEIQKQVIEMVQFGFKRRNKELQKIISISSEITIKERGAVFAAVVLWWK